MAVPRKAISQKNFAGYSSGLIFEGCATKALAEFIIPTKSKISRTLKDQSASPEPYRYRLGGNGHPWQKPRPSSAVACPSSAMLWRAGYGGWIGLPAPVQDGPGRRSFASILIFSEEQNPWQDQRTCGSARLSIVATSTTPTEGTGRGKYRKARGLRTCRRTGNVRSAVQVRKCFGLSRDPVRWLQRGYKGLHGIGTLGGDGIFLDRRDSGFNIRNHS